jgi:hypothetical protein
LRAYQKPPTTAAAEPATISGIRIRRSWAGPARIAASATSTSANGSAVVFVPTASPAASSAGTTSPGRSRAQTASPQPQTSQAVAGMSVPGSSSA